VGGKGGGSEAREEKTQIQLSHKKKKGHYAQKVYTNPSTVLPAEKEADKMSCRRGQLGRTIAWNGLSTKTKQEQECHREKSEQITVPMGGKPEF